MNLIEFVTTSKRRMFGQKRAIISNIGYGFSALAESIAVLTIYHLSMIGKILAISNN